MQCKKCEGRLQDLGPHYKSFSFTTPGIQKHVTVLNTRNGTKVYIGMIKGELYLFSNNKQCGHLPTANVYIHIEYYF